MSRRIRVSRGRSTVAGSICVFRASGTDDDSKCVVIRIEHSKKDGGLCAGMFLTTDEARRLLALLNKAVAP